MSSYRSARMRKKDTEYRNIGGIRKYCLSLFETGCTYAQVAERIGIPFGTMVYYMGKWRKEERKEAAP